MAAQAGSREPAVDTDRRRERERPGGPGHLARRRWPAPGAEEGREGQGAHGGGGRVALRPGRGSASPCLGDAGRPDVTAGRRGRSICPAAGPPPGSQGAPSVAGLHSLTPWPTSRTTSAGPSPATRSSGECRRAYYYTYYGSWGGWDGSGRLAGARALRPQEALQPLAVGRLGGPRRAEAAAHPRQGDGGRVAAGEVLEQTRRRPGPSSPPRGRRATGGRSRRSSGWWSTSTPSR